MPTSKSNEGRLALPSNRIPEGFRCVNVVIPDDNEYYLSLIKVMTKYLAQQTMWERDNTRVGAKLVSDAWKEAVYRTIYGDLCETSGPICRTFKAGQSDKFSFSPPEIDEPANLPGYEPLVWQSGSNVSSPIWAQDYLPTDIICTPDFNFDPLGILQRLVTLQFPRATFTFEGVGIAEVKLIKVFQGGSCMIVPDGDFSRAVFEITQLGSVGNIIEDLFAVIDSALTEKADPVEILEIEFHEDGIHTLDFYFLPYIDFDNPADPTAIFSSGNGGGIRSVEVCGYPMELEFRQNPDDNCLLEYRTDESQDFRLAFDYSLCQPEIGEGGGGLNIEIGTVIQFENILEQNITEYNNGPGVWPPGLPPWDTQLDAVLCLVVQLYVEAAIAAEITRVENNAVRDGIILAATSVVAGGVAWFTSGITMGLGLGIATGVIAAAGRSLGDNLAYLDDLKDPSAATCVKNLMYSRLAGSKPTLSGWRGSVGGTIFDDNDAAETVRQFIFEQQQPIETFVSFLGSVAEINQLAEAGFLGNDCSTDLTGCTSQTEWYEIIDLANLAYPYTLTLYSRSDDGRGEYIAGSGFKWLNGGITFSIEMPSLGTIEKVDVFARNPTSSVTGEVKFYTVDISGSVIEGSEFDLPGATGTGVMQGFDYGLNSPDAKYIEFYYSSFGWRLNPVFRLGVGGSGTNPFR